MARLQSIGYGKITEYRILHGKITGYGKITTWQDYRIWQDYYMAIYRITVASYPGHPLALSTLY
jgi:hypothetical protein